MQGSPATATRDAEYEWLMSRDTGLSSLTIFSVLSRKHGRYALRGYGHYSVPHDGDDLGRCIRLLKAVPKWRPRLHEVAAVFPEWTPLIREWDVLESEYDAALAVRWEKPSIRKGPNDKLYYHIQALIDEGRQS